jgi:predicted HAD superfamily Cof-like phosphohydrolase
MTNNNHKDVGNFHRRFGLVNTLGLPGPGPRAQVSGLMEFRQKFMQEELDEFANGLAENDIAQMADALVDLAYVVHGTAHFLGLPWQDLWDDVQRANMSKVRAAADGSDSKRGSAFDVIKPPGWRGPNTAAILSAWGWPE